MGYVWVNEDALFAHRNTEKTCIFIDTAFPLDLMSWLILICGVSVLNFGAHSYIGNQASRLYNFFPCLTRLNTKFILLINVKMPTIVGILTFISIMINTTSEGPKNQSSSFVSILVFISS